MTTKNNKEYVMIAFRIEKSKHNQILQLKEKQGLNLSYFYRKHLDLVLDKLTTIKGE